VVCCGWIHSLADAPLQEGTEGVRTVLLLDVVHGLPSHIPLRERIVALEVIAQLNHDELLLKGVQLADVVCAARASVSSPCNNIIPPTHCP
jgi:hypothetical protein